MKKVATKRVGIKRRVSAQPIDRVKERLKEMENRGEATFRPPTNFGPLPEMKLTAKLRKGELQRIIRAAKGCDD